MLDNHENTPNLGLVPKLWKRHLSAQKRQLRWEMRQNRPKPTKTDRQKHPAKGQRSLPFAPRNGHL